MVLVLLKAFEILELIAQAKGQPLTLTEISSILICAELGMNYNLSNHAPYFNIWIKNLKDDTSEFFSAIIEATKVADACLKYEKNINLTTLNVCNNSQTTDNIIINL